MKHHPWRYPGSAPVEDPCGIAGGWFTQGEQGNGGDAPPGIPQGELGTKSNFSQPLIDKTQWVAGSVVDVAWGITANHGGGYQYRLCPADSKLDEECFQKTPLDFVGNQTFRWGGKQGRKHSFKGKYATGDMVSPKGSMWAKNP